MRRLELRATVQELHDTAVITRQMLDGVSYQQLVAAVEKVLAVDDFFICSRVSLKSVCRHRHQDAEKQKGTGAKRREKS